MSITGRGSGQALLQLDYGFGTDITDSLEYPPKDAFYMEITSQFYGRNNSLIRITSCQSWIATDEADTSGVTVLDIHLPSGYHIMQDDLIDMVNEKKVRNLRWAQVSDSSV